MKRWLYFVTMLVVVLGLTGCLKDETVPKETKLDVLNVSKGSTLEQRHELESFEFITTYDACAYRHGSKI